MFGDVLIVDDEKDIRDLVAGILEDEGYQARLAQDSDSALRAISTRCPSLVVLDIWLQGSRLDGLEVLNILRERHPHLPVIIISGHGNIDTAITAIRSGAYDYIEKPFKSDKLLLTVSRAIEMTRLQRENSELRRKAGVNFTLLGEAGVIQQLNTKIDKLAQSNSRVMIMGPPGSGKEAAARQLHYRSPRGRQNFVAIHAAMLEHDEAQISRLLFGIEENGRVEPGLFEQAHGGTLYLDDVCCFPASVQQELLKVILDQSVTRIDGSAPVEIDVRLVSSCNADPQTSVKNGALREDLYHRLNVMTLEVPGLSQRRDDIPFLVDYFITSVADQFNMPAREIAPDAMAVLQSYDWPGNIRQLRNCIEHMMLASLARQSDVLKTELLPSEIISETDVNEAVVNSGHIMSLSLRDARERFEREYLLAQIDRFSGNISRTAEFVGMERSALHRKLKSLGIVGGNHAKSHA